MDYLLFLGGLENSLMNLWRSCIVGTSHSHINPFPSSFVSQVVKEIFGTMMGKYQAEDVFLAFIVDQGTNMVNACGW